MQQHQHSTYLVLLRTGPGAPPLLVSHEPMLFDSTRHLPTDSKVSFSPLGLALQHGNIPMLHALKSMADKADKTDTRATGSTGRANSAKSEMILLKRPLTEALLPPFSLVALCSGGRVAR